MAQLEKGRSPFYPGQPVSRELFTGRENEIQKLITRGVGQVAAGKPVAAFIQGEFGIGKSSIANMVGAVAEDSHGMHCIHAYLGGAKDLADVARMILEATVKSGALHPSRSQSIRTLLAKYVGKQSLFGVTLDLTALKADAPQLASASAILSFLSEVRTRLGGLDLRGVVLILDEINGITSNPAFAHFIKGVVDENAMSASPLPLFLILCGVEERRREMIDLHPPLDRVFDLVIDIEEMPEQDTKNFFDHAFQSVGMSVLPSAHTKLAFYSAGLPKVMHSIGEAAFWAEQDGVVDDKDVTRAVIAAADDIGKKFVDQQVLKTVRSKLYLSTLEKIAEIDPIELTFKKSDVVPLLTQEEKKTFDNFLQKMKQLGVIRSGVGQGEYAFVVRMVRVYLWLQRLKSTESSS
ncbi:MAG TPA: ATP-binding protein [Kofleriaceae bacterium]|nr:ATP-binding protein [Kofleriaceae bacterium]